MPAANDGYLRGSSGNPGDLNVQFRYLFTAPAAGPAGKYGRIFRRETARRRVHRITLKSASIVKRDGDVSGL